MVIFITPGGFAQKTRPQNDPGYDFKPLHFGFTIGINTMDFIVKNSGQPVDASGKILYADVSDLQPGFQVGIVSDLRLGEYFNLRFLPGISFGQRNFKFYYYDSNAQNTKTEYEPSTPQVVESSYIELPLLVKYKAKRLNNYRPYLIAGPDCRIDMSSRRGYDDEKHIYMRLKRWDLYGETGFGIDYYLKYFKFSTELKVAYGLRDVLVHDPAQGNPHYVEAIDRLNSSMIILSFHFE
ncbi:MAG: porin family protein [Bacteroidota bacterium]|nr:porin family protein [Bacteroidota bacterium]MDP4225664.1 porin family protein [Bacteroidota bacterium]MDP4273190.1 porin family protein [Bacteroidota bacterium]